MGVCEVLKDLRRERGLTQEQVAGILHIRRQVYARYEQGARDLPVRHLKALCQFYRVSADDVLGLSHR